jgi:sialic acid synthase SpsE
MQIGRFDLEQNVLVIAEIGNNHEGDFDTARELVRRAAECGVDAVKFQTFRTRYFVSTSDKARYDRLASFELTPTQFEHLHDLARSLGLMFISTPLDLESARFLESLVDCYKIASSDNNFYPLIEQVCGTGKPIVVSSGLVDLDQIEETKRFIHSHWQSRGISSFLAVLHCVTSYPAPFDQVNLAAVSLLAERLGCTVGYSDHTIGTEACLAAVALGARIIEKHFTLDKKFSDFRDHQISADPDEMKQLVRQVKLVRQLLGKPEKALQESEAAIEALVRRSIVAAADLPAGHKLRREDLTWIRPGGGLPPGKESLVKDRKLKRALSFGEQIRLVDVE